MQCTAVVGRESDRFLEPASDLVRTHSTGDGREAVTAAVFRLKTRAGWKEQRRKSTKHQLASQHSEHVGGVTSCRPTERRARDRAGATFLNPGHELAAILQKGQETPNQT